MEQPAAVEEAVIEEDESNAQHRMESVPPAGPFARPHPFYVGSVGASPIPPMPLVLPKVYGSPFLASGMRYNYGAARNTPGPYGLLSGYPGPITGMNYGPRPIEGYGFGFHPTPLAISSSWYGGAIDDNNASRKRRGGWTAWL